MNPTTLTRFSPARQGIFTLFICLSVLFSFSDLQAQSTKKAKPKWYPYASDVANIKAKFPGNPSLENQDSDIGTKHSATSRFGDNTYMISYVVHSTTLAEHKKLADASLAAFRDKVNGQILNQSEWDIKGQKGLRASIAMADKDAKVEYRVILIGQIQYQVIVVAPTKKYDEKVAEKFLKKVKIKP